MHLWMHTVQKNCEKNQCVDSSPISFFFLTGFLFFSNENEGTFSCIILFFKKHHKFLLPSLKNQTNPIYNKKKRIQKTY
jgi:hypothetical protein